MKYTLINAVWELTMACNMRCKHCGSSCNDKQSDELTTDEALDLCDQLAELGMKEITLSGGEPTLRDDWHIIAKRLVDNGITTSIITNGWILDETMMQNAKDAGIYSVAISIDGFQETHDKIRRKGSFAKDIESIKKLNTYGLRPSVITTLHEGNLKELETMYTCFCEIGVFLWQLQIALPMGNFTHHKDLYLKPEHVSTIIDFAHAKLDGPIYMSLGDSVGYYTQKEQQVHSKIMGHRAVWTGCSAGKYVIGILCNGDIVGCTSIRNREFVEGNIRNTPLKDIWNSKEHFCWSRQLKASDLKGFCGECIYNATCLGGCSNSRYCFGNDICSENLYCAYNQEMKKYSVSIQECDDIEELKEFAYSCIEQKQYQVALMCIKKLLEHAPDTPIYLEWKAFIQFQIGHYDECIEINSHILDIQPNHNGALKGLGLATYMKGDKKSGIELLEQSLENGTADNYADLYRLYQNENRLDDADKLKEEAFKRFSVDISQDIQ